MKENVKNIHLKFRSVSRDIWQYREKKVKRNIFTGRSLTVNLDSAQTSFHNEISQDNSSEMLWILSLYSAEVNLPKTFSTRIKIIPDILDIQDYFQSVYWEIRKIWHEEYPANILFTGADVIFVKPVDFAQFSGFQMFNYAHPSHAHKSRVGNRPHVSGGSDIFDHYFNADVRYYSHDMEELSWQIGDSWADNWTNGVWEYEQDLWNAMVRSQGNQRIQIIPEYAYQAPVNEFDDYKLLYKWNGIPLESANLIHLHSSRSPRRALDVAKKLIFES